jgi:hypothetical protein
VHCIESAGAAGAEVRYDRAVAELGESSAAPSGFAQFAFVRSARPLVQGTIIAVGLLTALAAWAAWTGRLRYADGTYAAVMIACVVGGVALTLGRMWRTAGRAAAALGRLELDDTAVRWRQVDGSLGFDVAWTEVARATVDARNDTVLLFKHDGGAIPLGVLSSRWTPAGFVVLERFAEIVARVSAKVPTAPHAGSADTATARRLLTLGAVTAAVAAGLYAANVALAARLHWHRLVAIMPIVVGLIALVTIVAGVRVRAGHGPLLSPIYGPSHRAAMLRFLVVATIANFALLALYNALPR